MAKTAEIIRSVELKRYEFWDPRIFNLPFYFYLAFKTLSAGLHPKNLFKANFALENGDLRASKYAIQKTVGMEKFPPTLLVEHCETLNFKRNTILRFSQKHGYPLIAKPDIGECGKAVKLVTDQSMLNNILPLIMSDYLFQPLVDLPLEYGVFYIRHQNRPQIIGINGKTFPSVVGNGRDSILKMICKDPHYSHHWQSFVKKRDLDQIPAEGEYIRLSQIGSHTMGCIFTDETHLVTPTLEKAIFALLEDVPGVNYGRLDVRTESIVAFQEGRFKLIEVNGISSLPTEMFDPEYSLVDAYRIFFKVADWLVKIACEHRHQRMQTTSFLRLFRQIQASGQILEETHRRFLTLQ